MGKVTRAEFARKVTNRLDDYYATVYDSWTAGNMWTEVPDPVPLFPQSLILSETPDYFIAEVVGGRERPRGLRTSTRNLASNQDWVGLFGITGKPMMKFEDTSNNMLARLVLIASESDDLIEGRFPGFRDAFPGGFVSINPELSDPIELSSGCNNIVFSRLILVPCLDGFARVRFIQHALIVSKLTPSAEFEAWLRMQTDTTDPKHELLGLDVFTRGHAHVLETARQFANIYLMNRLHETTIGGFLADHKEILLAGLDAKSIISEPLVPWQVSSLDPDETAINPDLFVERVNGDWEIRDLKLPLLGSRDATTGKRRRRRFKAPIPEGLAQLAHYRDALAVPENAAFAQEKYGAKFDNPRVGLVVGNSENIDREFVKEASRSMISFELVDYDSLLQRFLIKHGAGNAQING